MRFLSVDLRSKFCFRTPSVRFEVISMKHNVVSVFDLELNCIMRSILFRLFRISGNTVLGYDLIISSAEELTEIEN